MRVIESQRTSLIIVFVTWAVAQALAYYIFGINTSIDTGLYVNDARSMLSGHWQAIEMRWHLGYSLLIAGVLFLGGSLSTIILVQLFLSVIALLAVYYITFNVSANRSAAFIASILFAVWPDISQWNFIVYTDPVFTSCVVISVAAWQLSRKTWHYAIAGVITVFTMMVRPVGAVFFIALLFYASGKTSARRYIIGAIILCVGLFVMNTMMKEYIDSFLSSYARAEIIYPNVSLGLQAPADLFIPGEDHKPVVRLILFVVNNPIYFLKMSAIKGILYIGHVKPYFSFFHNALIAVFLWPLYIFAVIGVRTLTKSGFRNFTIAFIILQILMVSLTSENWDGRFLLPLLPWVFILSSVGITTVIKNRRFSATTVL